MREAYIIRLSDGRHYTVTNLDTDYDYKYRKLLGCAKGECTKHKKWGQKLTYEVWYACNTDPLVKIKEGP